MVTTRRQSHGLPNEELRDGSEIDTPRNISSKGKNKRSERPISPALPAKRRKTRLEHLDNDGHNPSGRSVPTAPEQRRPTVQVVIAVDDENEGHKQEEQSLGSVARKSSSKEGRDGPGKGDYDKTPGVKPREQLAPSQDNKTNPNRAPYGQDDQMWVEASDLKVKPDGKTTGTAGMSTAPKATHLRFGNEENDVNALNVNEGRLRTDTLSVTVVEGSEESDAEDEAPEMITAYMGAEIAKARNKDADMAAERQRAAAKEKRRERNDLLRQQAQFSKKAMKRKAAGTSDDKSEFDDVTDSAPSRARTIGRHPLPALLPDDILAAEPAVRPATPPLAQEPSKEHKPRKHLFVETDPKAPKDIKRGPVKVRVLEGGRQNLPPEACKESRNLKELWLGGRRGRNGAAVVERRKVGFGFARK